MRCEGWRRTGGAFSFGPPEWKQCKNDAIVTLTVTQDRLTEQLLACQMCWSEAIAGDIEISAVTPLMPPPEVSDSDKAAFERWCKGANQAGKRAWGHR